MNAAFPTSAWRENQSALAGKVAETLWVDLVMAYSILEIDRARFSLAANLPPEKLLPPKEAEALKKTSNELGRLRKKLGVGGGWLDEVTDELKA